MHIKKNLFLTLLLSLLTLFSTAKAQVLINNIDLLRVGNTGELKIFYTGVINEYPELEVKGSEVTISLLGVNVRRPLSKDFNFATKSNLDTKVKAQNIGNNKSLIKVLLPFDLDNLKNKVSLTIKDNLIQLMIPHKMVTTRPLKQLKEKRDLKQKEYLNEKYLNKLIEDEENIANPALKAKESKDKSFLNQNSRDSGTKLAKKESFSFSTYALKFLAFLSIVLLVFYAIVALLKKGVLKKGKLGLFKNTNKIEVLTQTHIAPKKSLMIIKAYDQVFLVSNTEAGIHPISEMKNPTSILKDGEKVITGSNFDEKVSDLGQDEDLALKVKIKEDINTSEPLASKSEKTPKDIVRFSEQIKKKVKGLRPLQ